MSLLSIIATMGGAAAQTPPPSNTPLLIVFSGESNSGGQAHNADATTLELSERSGVKILNNDSLTLENLHIGVNNELGHVGFNSTDRASYHGWELELANQVASGNMPNPVYLAKTGQGGSRITNWVAGATYSAYSETVVPWTAMQDRVDAAINQIQAATGKNPKVYLFYSQGINDILAGMDSASWKAATLAHFDKIDAKWGSFGEGGKLLKFMTNFHTSQGDEAYNTVITQIATERDEVYEVDSTGLTTNDQHHWNYAGMKTLCQRIVASLKANYTV